MMSSIIKFFIFILSISAVYSFGLAPRRVVRPSVKSASTLKMAWGLQKLGQPVINIESVAAPAPAVGTLFISRRQSTNGNDDRATSFGGNDSSVVDLKEKQYDELAVLDLNFKKQTLLMGLSAGWSEAEKIQRINIAASVEGLLPSSLDFSSVSTLNMKAGGLTSDWDFDF